MTPDCMTPDELELWRAAARDAGGEGKSATRPCIDCPLWFAEEMRGKGCCNGDPTGMVVRSWAVPKVRRYATEDERVEARRRSWRMSARRKQASRAANTRSIDAYPRYNSRVGSSDESNRIATVARVSATTRDAGDVASIEVVAR